MNAEEGSFTVTMYTVTSQLMQWFTRSKLEQGITTSYGSYLYFMDTTHNTTKFTLKSGPIVPPDCFGEMFSVACSKYLKK